MTSFEWFALVAVPVLLVLGGFLAERAHAFSMNENGQSFFQVIKSGKPSFALVPAALIIAVALILTQAFK
jgi:hypothetical protein